MKIESFLRAAFLALLLSTLNSQLSTCFAQGSLSPPAGAPAPTMKTLDQVESRTPIDSTHTPGDSVTLFRITQPGSYYLTGNIIGVSGESGILIEADNVSLDLNGFALIGVSGSVNGIAVNGSHHNVAVHNGTVRAWGFSGLNAAGAFSSIVTNIRASHNGTDGIRVGLGSTVSKCVAYANTSGGIVANGKSVIELCAANSNLIGISVGVANDSGLVNRCVASANTSDGIVAEDKSVIQDCVIAGNGDDGIQAGTDCRLNRNETSGNSAAGIHLTGSGNTVEGNRVLSNLRGLDIDGAGNTVASNVVRINTNNYDIAAGNQLEILLCQVPQTIAWPARVKLAGSLTGVASQNGITITSDNVTIDLEGHALIGIASSLDGINVSGAHKNIVIKNGTVHSWAGDGIDAATSTNGQFDRLELTDNTGRGIHAGDRCLVTDCTARSNTGGGIEANIIATISRCIAHNNSGFGIKTADTSQIEKCNLNNNPGGGISVTNNCLVRENNCDFHLANGAGILVTGSRNRIESNHVTRNVRGIDVDGTNNLIIKNSASDNSSANYDIVANNAVGSTVVAPASVAFAGNTGGAGVGSTDPWANISY